MERTSAALLSSVLFLNTYAIEKLESIHFAAVVEAVVGD